MYNQPNNETLVIESTQYTAAVKIPGTIKRIFQLRLYKDLSLESLRFRRWCRGLCVLEKI